MGDDPAVLQIGWEEESDMKAGWKNSKDGNGAASFRSFCSHQSTTCFLTRGLKACLVGGAVSRAAGWGRVYFRQRFLTCWNHDLGDEVMKLKMFFACWLRTFYGSLVIITKMESCWRWRKASPGGVPARKKTTALGVRGNIR